MYNIQPSRGGKVRNLKSLIHVKARKEGERNREKDKWESRGGEIRGRDL